MLALSAALVTTGPGANVAGAAEPATLTSYTPTSTSYTGIDPGAGLFYSYAPSAVQTNPTTRYVYYCQNAASGVVIDHVYLSVGHLKSGRWQYGSPTVVLSPAPNTYYSVHTCEPQVIAGKFRFGGKPYGWAMFFTAESVATNSTNRIGLAFANSLRGPFTVDPTALVQQSDDFGQNSYPNNCPTYPTGNTLYCLGEPAATTISGGRIVLAYMGNAGSPGNDSNVAEGLVLQEINLSNVPASGPCPACFLTLPGGGKIKAVTASGLKKWGVRDASIAYDASDARMVMSFDDGPADSTPNGPPVNDVVTVASLPINNFLRGNGSWREQDHIGQCLSGYTDNHNSGIVQSSNGDIPPGNQLTVIYTVADDNLRVDWGVWDYRLWSVNLPLTGPALVGTASLTKASASCPGLDVVDASGKVDTGGSARSFGSAPDPGSGGPIVAMALTPDREGYYLVTQKGRVLTYGDARSQGSVPSIARAKDVVGIALDATTGGYWIARANGAVYGLGAPQFGSFTPTASSGPVVAIAGIPNGEGYYLVTANGDVSAFGQAVSYGNFGVPAGQTIAAMAPLPNGLGYYLVTKQGTIGAFGDAQLYGPTIVPTKAPMAAMAVATNGFGYWTISSSGVVTGAGNAKGRIITVDPGAKAIVVMAAF